MKVLNVKAKAMTVEKIMDDKERKDLKDLKQQIESLSMIMKSATIGSMKPKGREGVCHRKGCRDHPEKEKYL